MKDVVKSILIGLGVVVVVVGILALVFGLLGLIWWGLGAFIIWAFAIDFTWTFWHGLATAIILNTLGGIFGITVKKEN